MNEPTRVLRPQAAIDIAQRIRRAIHTVDIWCSSLRELDKLRAAAAELGEVEICLTLTKAEHTLSRNPPKEAIETLSRLAELQAQMDELDRTESAEIVPKDVKFQ